MARLLRGEPLGIDGRTAAVTIIGTLLLLIDAYHPLTPGEYLDRLLLYLAVPLLIIVLAFRESPRDYGFALGDWKLGLLLSLGGILLTTPVIWLLARNSAAIRAYYAGMATGLPWTTFLDLVGWEFFFRGWLLFAYARRFGADALWLQAVPFALAHIGKPEIETVSTIFGGFAFGYMAYKTRSFVWPFLTHWYISTLVILSAATAAG